MTGLEEWKDKERTKKTRKGKSKHPGILKRTTKIITARNNHKATLQKIRKRRSELDRSQRIQKTIKAKK